MDLQKAANIAQVVSVFPGLFCAYTSWISLPHSTPGTFLESLSSGGVAVLAHSPLVLMSFGAFVGLAVVAIILRLTAKKATTALPIDWSVYAGAAEVTSSVVPKQPIVSKFWDGFLEAVTTVELIAGCTGRVAVRLTHGAAATLEALLNANGNREYWGGVNIRSCHFPFKPEGGMPTAVKCKLELRSVRKGMRFSSPTSPFELRWDDATRDLESQILAATTGVHEIDVVLLVEEMVEASLSLQTRAHRAEKTPQASASGGYREVATLRVKVEVKREIVQAVDLEQHLSEQNEMREEQGNKKKKGYGIGM